MITLISAKKNSPANHNKLVSLLVDPVDALVEVVQQNLKRIWNGFIRSAVLWRHVPLPRNVTAVGKCKNK